MFVTPEQLAAELLAKANGIAKAGTAVIATATRIQARAKINVPVDTGNLKGSITRESRRYADGAESVVGPEANYGAYVENGTSRMPPQPYLLPAALDEEDDFYGAIASIVGFDATPSLGTGTTIPGGGL